MSLSVEPRIVNIFKARLYVKQSILNMFVMVSYIDPHPATHHSDTDVQLTPDYFPNHSYSISHGNIKLYIVMCFLFMVDSSSLLS